MSVLSYIFSFFDLRFLFSSYFGFSAMHEQYKGPPGLVFFVDVLRATVTGAVVGVVI